jgi:hypothetical protein
MYPSFRPCVWSFVSRPSSFLCVSLRPLRWIHRVSWLAGPPTAGLYSGGRGEGKGLEMYYLRFSIYDLSGGGTPRRREAGRPGAAEEEGLAADFADYADSKRS